MAQVAAYAFNEGTGSTAAEVAGGTAITGVPGWATGRQGSAMFLNLVNGPTVTPYTSNTSFTMMFDVYMEGDGGSGYNIFLSNTAGVGNIQCDSTGNLEWYHDTGTTGNIALLNDGTWYNIACVADGTNRRVLVNGTQVFTYANTARSTTGNIKIGGDLGGGYTANFRMDNLRFFNTALTNGEIATLQGTAAAVEPLGVSINDNVGITDTRSIGSSARFITLSDSVGVADTGAPQSFDLTESRPDPVGITDAVTRTITTSGGPTAPTANAGPDQTVDTNTLVTLNGTGSTIPAGQTAKSYVWAQLSGPTVSLSGTGAIRTFTATTAGTYVFSLVVNTTVDATGVALQSTADTVTITVNAPTPTATTPSIFYSDGVQWYAL